MPDVTMLGTQNESNLRAYDRARDAAGRALLCWANGNWTPAGGWARRAVEYLPVGTEVRRRAAEICRLVAHADRQHPEQGRLAQERLLSLLRTVENAYWQLYLAQPADEHWLAL